MRCEYRKVKLADLTITGKGTYGIAASGVEKNDNLYTYLRITDINDDGTLNRSDMKSVADDDAAQYLLKPNDIVFARTGGSTGRNYFYDGKDGTFVYAGFLIKFSIDPLKVNPKYIKYYCQSDVYKNWVRSFNTGSTRGNINAQTFGNMEIPLPPREQQDYLVSVLEPLDEKIAINRAINDNLAEQAQGMLRHFMDQYQYQLNSLSTIAEVIDCLHSKKPSAIEGSTYQLIQLDNIRDDGFLDMSVCKYMISQADYENWTRKCEIIEGDCVITNVGRIGAVSQAPYGTRAAMGRNMTCIRMKSGLQLPAYFITALLSSHMRRQIQQNTDEGTIMGALNVKNIPKLLFPIFVPSVMSDLETILYPLRKQIEYNNLQNQNLAQLRDTLISRLMSGEIDVSAVQL